MTQGSIPTYQVRTVHCDHRADDEAVYQALRRATDPLERAWARLAVPSASPSNSTRTKPSERVVMLAGQRQQLVSDSVVRATLRLLRERTSAEIICVDVSFYVTYNGRNHCKHLQYRAAAERVRCALHRWHAATLS